MTNQLWQCRGRFMAIRLQLRGSSSDHSFPAADPALIATSDSALIPTTTGGRLAWLPHVRGPKVLADTNGQYHDEPVRFFDCLFAPPAASASEQDLITPGRFEFELGRRPSVLIFSIEDPAVSRRDQHIGLFLAGLMEGSAARAGSSVGGSAGVPTQQLTAA